jgi:hypothetical protein
MRRIALLLAPLVIAAAPEQGTLYFGGPIVTMHGDAPETVEAVLVSGGKIVALGPLASLEKRARQAQRVDLKGRTLLPGFIDAHGHASFVGQNAGMVQLQPPPIGGVDNLNVMQAVLRDWIARNPNAPVVVGNGFDDSQLAEKRFPTRHDLDQVSATKPIIALHVSGHLAVLNSAALNMVGIGPDTPEPQGGVIRRDADGKTPDGVLEERAMEPLFAILIPKSVEPGIAAMIAQDLCGQWHHHRTGRPRHAQCLAGACRGRTAGCADHRYGRIARFRASVARSGPALDRQILSGARADRGGQAGRRWQPPGPDSLAERPGARAAGWQGRRLSRLSRD